MIDTALYYNPQKLLSYDRILNFVIGARGIGKSYAFKRHPINRFLKHGEQFIYLRRYKPELKKIGNYFNDIQEAFPEHQFKVKGREMYIDGKLAGWAIPLSTWQSEKSNAYPNVTSIIYDEFIREKDNSGYLPNEVEALLNLMDTVFRGRDNVRCFCLSNAVSVVNPYFLYFGIIPDIGKRFNAYSDYVVEIPDSVDFSEERRKTKFGRLIDGTEYGAMSLDNEFVNDTSIFIQRRTPVSRFQFSITFKGMTMGVWVDRDEGIMFLSNDHDPSTKHHYVLSQDDMKENTLLISGWKTHFHLRKLGFAFKNGYLRFDNQVIRTTGYELFKKMNV